MVVSALAPRSYGKTHTDHHIARYRQLTPRKRTGILLGQGGVSAMVYQEPVPHMVCHGLRNRTAVAGRERSDVNLERDSVMDYKALPSPLSTAASQRKVSRINLETTQCLHIGPTISSGSHTRLRLFLPTLPLPTLSLLFLHTSRLIPRLCLLLEPTDQIQQTLIAVFVSNGLFAFSRLEPHVSKPSSRQKASTLNALTD